MIAASSKVMLLLESNRESKPLRFMNQYFVLIWQGLLHHECTSEGSVYQAGNIISMLIFNRGLTFI